MATGDDPSRNSTLDPVAAWGTVVETAQPTRGCQPSGSARRHAAEDVFARHDFGDHVELVKLAHWQVDEDGLAYWRPLRAHLKAHPDRQMWLIYTVRFMEGEGAGVQGAHATDHEGIPWGLAQEATDACALDAADRALLLAALECHGDRLEKSCVAAPDGEAAIRTAALHLRLSRMTTGA